MNNERTKPGPCEGCRLYDAEEVSYESVSAPDIVFIGGAPTHADISNGAFRSVGGLMVRKIFRELVIRIPSRDQPRVAYAYACRCLPECVDWKILKDDIDKCSPQLYTRLDHLKPKLIVALGADATKALGFTETHSSLRGTFLKKTFGDWGAQVLVTAHPTAVMKKPGLLQLFKNDLQKAVNLISHASREENFELELPLSYPDIMTSLDRFEEAIEANWRDQGRPLLVSCDTETTSLHPWAPEERVILVSLSYRKWHGLAYPWQHRDAPLTDEQFQVVRGRTERLLADSRIYLAMANAKFDQQWMRHKYGLDIREADWDVLLQEHALDEDKKGEYSLKTLTADYFPWAAKYEGELQSHLAAIKKKRAEDAKELTQAHREQLQEVFVDYWVGLSMVERIAKTSQWVQEALMKISETSAILEPKRRKLKGEMILTKGYKTAVVKALSRLPVTALAVELPDAPELPDPKDVTYEDLPLDVLIRYAAIDAIVTRMLVPEQQQRMKEDGKLIRQLERAQNRTFPTQSLFWAQKNLTNPLCQSIAHMEYHGVRLDRDRIRQYIGVLDTKLEETMSLMVREYGQKFNPSASAGDLSSILYGYYNLPVLKRTEGGAPSTDAETIKFLADDHPLPFLEALLAYRKCEKVRSTYLANWLRMSEKDGRIHASFNQNGTATFRLSSSSPNLQNIPFYLKEADLNLKALFLPDSDEYDLYDLDISNAEMRILCAYSRDPALIKAFLNNMDLHSLTAAGISDFEYDDINANKEDKHTPHYRVRQIGKKVGDFAFSKAT